MGVLRPLCSSQGDGAMPGDHQEKRDKKGDSAQLVLLRGQDHRQQPQWSVGAALKCTEQWCGCHCGLPQGLTAQWDKHTDRGDAVSLTKVLVPESSGYPSALPGTCPMAGDCGPRIVFSPLSSPRSPKCTDCRPARPAVSSPSGLKTGLQQGNQEGAEKGLRNPAKTRNPNQGTFKYHREF